MVPLNFKYDTWKCHCEGRVLILIGMKIKHNLEIIAAFQKELIKEYVIVK